MNRSILASLVFVAIAGCAPAYSPSQFGPEHPASSSAAEAPPTPASTTLGGAPQAGPARDEQPKQQGHGHHGMHGGAR